MPFVSRMMSFWRNLFRRKQVEQDLNDELQAYVDELAERKIQAGISMNAAHEAALMELGGIDRIKDLVRQQRVGHGGLRTATAFLVVALIAFVSGGSLTLGLTKWSASSEPLEAPGSPVKKHRFNIMSGRVVDKATGAPIPFVEVGLNEIPTFGRYTYTNEHGEFAFLNPPANYSLRAGQERWAVGGPGVVEYAAAAPSTGYYYVSVPNRINGSGYSNLVIRNKADNNPFAGDQTPIHGVGFVRFGANPERIPYELRRFSYSSTVLELAATDLPAGTPASAWRRSVYRGPSYAEAMAAIGK
jgi:hypothetical protein